MSLEVVILCPLTQKPKRCEYVEDNKLHRCGAYETVMGEDAKTHEPMEITRCIINLLPVLLIENTRQQHHTAAAVESFRNETVQGNSLTQLILHSAAQTRLANLEDR